VSSRVLWCPRSSSCTRSGSSSCPPVTSFIRWVPRMRDTAVTSREVLIAPAFSAQAAKRLQFQTEWHSFRPSPTAGLLQASSTFAFSCCVIERRCNLGEDKLLSGFGSSQSRILSSPGWTSIVFTFSYSSLGQERLTRLTVGEGARQLLAPAGHFRYLDRNQPSLRGTRSAKPNLARTFIAMT